MTSETDPDLGPVPDALAAGRERAFSDVYDRYANRLYRVALTITRSQTDAEDAVHDTFLALWSSRTSWTA